MNKTRITIEGCNGSGKTRIMHIIGKALEDAGLSVKAIDEAHAVTNFSPSEGMTNCQVTIITKITGKLEE